MYVTWIATTAAALTGRENAADFEQNPCPLALAAVAAGPGSKLQRRLFSLLCTKVKLGQTSPVGSQTTASQSGTARYGLIKAAVLNISAVVAGATCTQQSQPHSDDSGDRPAARSVVSMLPAVFIMGRCCMWWAEQLQSDLSSSGSSQASVKHAPEVLLVTAVQQWLQASSSQEQLVAAGYAPQALPQQLQQVTESLQGARDSKADRDKQAHALGAAAQQLQAAGSALCSFAVPCMCNNPACSNLSGLTEVGLVSGRSCVCGGCRVARYCGRACQRAVWKQHKPVCAALAAATANASLVAGAAAADPAVTADP
jgi:hypothetical protein